MNIYRWPDLRILPSLLRAQVGSGAHGQALHGKWRRIDHSSNAEIRGFAVHPSPGDRPRSFECSLSGDRACQQDVARLDVPMHDAMAMNESRAAASCALSAAT